MAQLKNYKLSAFIVFFIALSFFDIIGITIITPFIEIAFNKDFSLFENLFGFLKINLDNENFIFYFGIIICFIFVIKLTLYVLCNYFIFTHCFNNGTFLRINLLQKYFNNIDENLNKYSNSDLIYRILTEKDLRLEMSRNARDRALDKWSMEVISDLYYKLYKKIIIKRK